jgi:hypothetical protein
LVINFPQLYSTTPNSFIPRLAYKNIT